MNERTPAILALLTVAACAGSGSHEPVVAHSPPAATGDAASNSTVSDAAASSTSVANPPKSEAAKPSFSMPAFDPPHARSALPGDGQWVPVNEAGEDDGVQLMLTTTVHPHPVRKDVYAVVVAVDLKRVELVWVPGMKEPETKSVPAAKRHGIVAASDREKLVAAFNGGFMAKHGSFGAMLDGDVYLPPRDGACTVGMGKDGSLRVAPWEEMSASASELAAYRQTPPCLVHNGELHPLTENQHVKWGLSADGKFDIRRSALGIAKSGHVLFLGIGEWVLPREIAQSMKLAGATSVAELDINWSFTRFNFYGKKDGTLQVTSTLIPKLVHTKKSYVGEAAERDLFYINHR